MFSGDKLGRSSCRSSTDEMIQPKKHAGFGEGKKICKLENKIRVMLQILFQIGELRFLSLLISGW